MPLPGTYGPSWAVLEAHSAVVVKNVAWLLNPREWCTVAPAPAVLAPARDHVTALACFLLQHVDMWAVTDIAVRIGPEVLVILAVPNLRSDLLRRTVGDRQLHSLVGRHHCSERKALIYALPSGSAGSGDGQAHGTGHLPLQGRSHGLHESTSSGNVTAAGAKRRLRHWHGQRQNPLQLTGLGLARKGC